MATPLSRSIHSRPDTRIRGGAESMEFYLAKTNAFLVLPS
jgi:hypothetical protein